MELLLNMGILKSEGIWQLRAFFTVSTIPADLHPDKTMLFDFWSVLIIWGENNGN